MSKHERRSYIKAVKCLAKLPAKTPAAIASGAKSRYDDLVVTHIQQAFTIHGTANFLTWHRYYTWAFEQMLRNECGYKGYQPYYNWYETLQREIRVESKLIYYANIKGSLGREPESLTLL